jgi:hypothetical protein
MNHIIMEAELRVVYSLVKLGRREGAMLGNEILIT